MTLPNHMPTAHRKHAEWSPGRLVSWARTSVGPHAGELVQQIFITRPHPKQGYAHALASCGSPADTGLNALRPLAGAPWT